MIKLLQLFTTHNPKKRFALECQLMLHYSQKGSKFLRKRFQRRLYYIYGCEISHTAIIDSSVEFVHPIGVIIGSRAIVHKGCKIYQEVTLGSQFLGDGSMPTILENCYVGAGAKVIGGITIGKNSIIGANAIVTKSAPANSIVIGANIIKKRSDL